MDELEAVSQINNADFICITETWLNSSIPDSAVSLANYLIFRNDRLSSSGGGVCIYVNSKFSCKRLRTYEDQGIESLWMSIRPPRLPRSISIILLAVIYHSTSCGAAENVELYNHIQSNVDTFLRNHPDALLLITGDFNPSSTGFDVRMVKRIAGLTQIINVKTRGNAILDWCLTNAKKSFFEQVQLPQLGTSDHNTILIKTRIPRPQKPDNRPISKRDLRYSSLRRFGQWISSYDWSPVLHVHDCDLKFQKFHDIIENMVDKFLPITRTKVSQCDEPWMTPSLKSSISNRQKALYKHGKSSTMFKYWRNKVIMDVKSARAKYYATSVRKLKQGNSSKWWKEVKSIGGLSSRGSWHYQLLTPVNPTCQHLVESINTFFTSLTSHFSPLQPDSTVTQLDVPASFLVDTGQVYQALRKIKTNKSPGPDLIPNKILKMFAFELAPVIADVYNSSLSQGVVPSQLKLSIVRPIPKVLPPTSIEDDLRPISLTSQISKIMERFTINSLMPQVIDQLDPKQFALPNKSTTYALVYLLHQILAALDSGHNSIRLFFADFRKGFDLVDHSVIINELENLNVHPVLTRWIKAFLTNRQQCVKVDCHESSWKTTNGGLPQGTCLGPLLFAILVNPLLKDWNGRLKFVDDTTALEVVPRCSPSLLPLVVQEISNFSSARGMELNPKKCKEMIINFLQYRIPCDQSMFINRQCVERVHSFKILGVYLSDDLTWNTHVDHILKKANSRLFALRLLKKAGLGHTDLITIYCSVIRSVLEYASPVWAALPDYLSSHLESVQKRALKIIFPDISYYEALQSSKIKTLECRRDELCRRFINSTRKIACNNNPVYNIIRPSRSFGEHDYFLRRPNNSGTVRTFTERFDNFITIKYM